MGCFSMIKIYKPNIEDLWFRQSLIADEDTMSYNNVWGGTILFPKENWKKCYQTWIEGSRFENYYRYLIDTENNYFVGEIAYHYDKQRKYHICDVIILAKHRNKGYGSKGIQLLCDLAKENGISILYDDIAIDNISYKLFLKNGFTIDYQNDEIIMVKKVL